MEKVRIYHPTKSAMQQGRRKARGWIMEIDGTIPVTPDQLMGWPTTSVTEKQIRLIFDTLDQATTFAKAHDFVCEVLPSTESFVAPKSYGDNFSPFKPVIR